MNTLLLVCAALLPALILCIYIFCKDRTEKEPVSLLLLLLFAGALSCFPAAIIEGFLIESISASTSGIFRMAAENFIGIALVEEACKFAALYIVTKNSKHFNSLFDGIIYAVFVALGFAALENIFYVMDYGFGNALLRALTAVPGHMFDGVLMGYYYSLAHMYKKAAEHELSLAKQNYISVSKNNMFSQKPFMVATILWPTLAHGFYDFCCTVDSVYATIIFFIFLIFLYIYCFRKIKITSAKDISDMQYVLRLLIKKYPHLLDVIRISNQTVR